jgi:hypothetical protein
MAKEKQAKPAPGSSLADAGLESFVTREVHRSLLVGASYNPRIITDKEKGKLKAALKRHGLVAPVTWNKRTGNIVGGHQRMGIMDSLMGTSDYLLTVAEIDVDVAKEKELNVLLNNQQAMGSWDLDGLKNLFDDESVTLEGAGLDITDMIGYFGDDALNERQEDLSELASKLSELSSMYSAVQGRNVKKTTEEFFLVFVFPDGAHVDAFINANSMANNRYQSGKWLMDRLGIVLPEQQ